MESLGNGPSSPPSSILKTIFSAAVLALFPEINKRGTRSCPWNPQSIKPLWDASTWHKQSDLTTMSKSYSALWDLGDTIALPFPKHTLVSMSSGPPGVFEQPGGLCSEEDKYMLPGKKTDRCQRLPSLHQPIAQHTSDYECVEYINRLIVCAHKLTRKLNPFGLLGVYIANASKINLPPFSRAQEVRMRRGSRLA